MRIARLNLPEGAVHVRADGDGWVLIENPYVAFAMGRAPEDIGGVVTGPLLPPASPTIVVGIAQNGPRHVEPVQAWLKSPRTVVASGHEVMLRRDAGLTVAEAEIAVVIGRDTEGLTAATAHQYVVGVTAVNDLSSPERSKHDPRNFESKAGDGYTPLGPWIDTICGIDDVPLALHIDDAIVAETSSADLPVSIRECLAYVAKWTRLGPGDIVMTGAPLSAAPITPSSTAVVRVGDMTLVTPTR